jgi:hypothetical protein
MPIHTLGMNHACPKHDSYFKSMIHRTKRDYCKEEKKINKVESRVVV